MTLRTQNLRSILPVFLLLAVGSLGLTLKTERDEYLWGLREEAGALAVTTAEFLSSDAYRGSATGRLDAAGVGRVRTALDRTLNGDVVTGGSGPSAVRRGWRRISCLTPDGRRVLFSRGARSVDGVPLLPSAEDLAAIGRGAPAGIALRSIAGGRVVMTAYAPIRDRNGERVGWVGVETDAGGIALLTRQILIRSALGIGAVLLLGAGATLVATGIVARDVRELRCAAVFTPGEGPGSALDSGRIGEISDLKVTLRTMNEVLQDVLARTRRSLLDGEQLREPAELARAYTEQFQPPLTSRFGSVQVAARWVGDSPGRSFHTAFPVEGGAWALVGRVCEESGSPLDGIVAASAACSLLSEQLEKQEPAAAIATVCDLFPLEQLDALLYRADGVERWTLEGQVRGAQCAVRREVGSTHSGRLVGAVTAHRAPRTAHSIVLHTLGPAATARIERYVEHFGALDAASLLADLAAIQEDTQGGSLVVVRES